MNGACKRSDPYDTDFPACRFGKQKQQVDLRCPAGNALRMMRPRALQPACPMHAQRQLLLFWGFGLGGPIPRLWSSTCNLLGRTLDERKERSGACFKSLKSCAHGCHSRLQGDCSARSFSGYRCQEAHPWQWSRHMPATNTYGLRV